MLCRTTRIFQGIKQTLRKRMFRFVSGDFVNVQGMSTMTVNGKIYKGNSIMMGNGNVIVDGVTMEKYGMENQHSYIVQITGNPQKIETMGSVTVTGDCGDINTMGSVNIGGSCGNINTMGKVTIRGKN